MENVRQDRDAIREARARPGEVAVGINSEDAVLADRGQIVPGFGRVERAPPGGSADGIVATGHDHDNFGVRLGNLLGGDFKGWLPYHTEDVFTASLGDHFGNPMPADIKRIKPFEAENARTRGGARSLHFDGGDLLFDGEREGLRIAAAMRSVADAANVFPDIG